MRSVSSEHMKDSNGVNWCGRRHGQMNEHDDHDHQQWYYYSIGQIRSPVSVLYAALCVSQCHYSCVRNTYVADDDFNSLSPNSSIRQLKR